MWDELYLEPDEEYEVLKNRRAEWGSFRAAVLIVLFFALGVLFVLVEQYVVALVYFILMGIALGLAFYWSGKSAELGSDSGD
jgi:hypothetical protein